MEAMCRSVMTRDVPWLALTAVTEVFTTFAC